jgi:hypothetical protein
MQIYNTTMTCLGLGGRKKHAHATDKLFPQALASAGGAAAPSALIPPSTEPGPASDDDPSKRTSTCPPTPHQRAPAALKRTGRSSLPSSPRKREWDRARTRVPPSQRTTCCETPWCGWPPSPGQRTECCTLAWQQQFAFPGMAGGRLLHRAGGWFPPPDAEGRSEAPAHADATPPLGALLRPQQG